MVMFNSYVKLPEGKPSISMGHLYHGELLVITRWFAKNDLIRCSDGQPGGCHYALCHLQRGETHSPFGPQLVRWECFKDRDRNRKTIPSGKRLHNYMENHHS